MPSRHLAAALLTATLLAGCGGFPVPNGETGCGGADFGTGNRESAGSYTGTYKNALPFGDSTALDLNLQLVISDQGIVTGTVTDAGGRNASVTGHLGDWFDPCEDDTTTLELGFTFEGDAARSLRATKKRRAFTTFSAKAVYRQNVGENPQLGQGTITITRSTPPTL